MRNYRFDTVELESVGTIPVLMACDRRKADGVVAHVTSVEEAKRLGCVRMVDLDALNLFVNDGFSFQKEYGLLSNSETKRLLGLLQLAEALKYRDEIAWKWACKGLSQELEYRLFPKLRILERQPGVELARLLAEGLKDVQLVLWWRQEGRNLVILPGLRCPDVRSTLYTLALIRIAGGKGLGACLNCGKPLVRQRGMRRKTCSDKCRYEMYLRKKKSPRKLRKKRKKP